NASSAKRGLNAKRNEAITEKARITDEFIRKYPHRVDNLGTISIDVTECCGCPSEATHRTRPERHDS
ncbi:hypothetical protein, partial [Schlesneria sp.]|uniref:hypothetical protein n=1 Tax=Schlesneria sp. TaxID=2762018 RepID=UPI002F048289